MSGRPTNKKAQQIAIDGTRETGQDVRNQNVTACLAIANVVRSSFGPVGLDKMLVDDIGDVVITNDGATILKQLEVQHPAAKALVDLADLQDQEVGDGTTSVVLISAELLKRGNELVKQKIHPTSILTGYRLACRESVKYIKEHLAHKVETLGRDTLISVAKTSMSSKIIGAESDFFSRICVDAMLRVKTVNSLGDIKYPVKSVNILKAHGKSMLESMFIEGYALNCTVASQAMPKKINNARIALLDFNLQKTKMSLGVKFEVSDPNKINEIQQRESDMCKERVQLILKAGANVILTTKGIDDLAMKYFVEAGAIGVRRCKKEDLRRIAKATGGKVVLSLANLEGDESFDAANLGVAEEVAQERISDNELILVRGTKYAKTSSIILRGPNSYTLDEMERSVHDALCTIKRTLESNEVVPGGGAVEAALSIYLENFARTLGSREQLAIAEFADALLVVPKTLAVNAAKDATELVAQLRAHHHASQTDAAQKKLASYGLDLIKGEVRNNLEAGVLEPAMGKVKCLQFAMEAAITILRIDEVIRLNPKPEPEGPED